MPMDRGTPDLVRHCVAAVAKQYGGDTQKAFAICVAQLQKNGYLKPGTMELTAAGKKKEKEHEAEPDAAKKMASYEKLLKAARKTESSDFDRLMNPSERSGFEDLPRTISRKYESVSAGESSMDAMRRLAGITSVLQPAHNSNGGSVFEKMRHVVSKIQTESNGRDDSPLIEDEALESLKDAADWCEALSVDFGGWAERESQEWPAKAKPQLKIIEKNLDRLQKDLIAVVNQIQNAIGNLH
jgi:hypothetical protein